MTPKEKATELFTKFSNNTIHYDATKQCALIAIDEMLDFHNNLYLKNSSSLAYQYLLEVKEEIKKL